MSITHIAIASDHGGTELKEALIAHLVKKHVNIHLIDLGTNSDESVDYPDFADKVVDEIQNGEATLGILVCGTGIGMSIKANRNPGIRAALVHSEFTAKMAKAHNNANILCLGQRTTDTDDALLYADIWLTTEFEGDRHERRVNKLG